MQRILIKHLTGARANQIDEFSPATAKELVVGRDPAANIRFDADRDDLVSRQHSRIACDPADPNAFQLIDLQSRNGTFLNRQRVYGAVRLNHNDTVQLGAGGPEFRFEIDPPPIAAARPTREAPESQAYPGIKPTRESWQPPAGLAPGARPVGRFTVERMLGDAFTRVKQESAKSTWIAGMALAAILVVGAGAWFYFRQSQSEQAIAQEKNLQSLKLVNEELKKNPAAANSMRAQIASLESQLRQSDQRNTETVQALMKEIDKRMNEEENLKAIAAQAPQYVPPPPPPPSAPVQPPPPQETPPVPSQAGQTYEALMEQATQQFQNGQARSALNLMQQAIEKDKSRWDGYEFAGQIAGTLKDYELASSMFRKALMLAPADNRQDVQYKLDGVKQKMDQK